MRGTPPISEEREPCVDFGALLGIPSPEKERALVTVFVTDETEVEGEEFLVSITMASTADWRSADELDSAVRAISFSGIEEEEGEEEGEFPTTPASPMFSPPERRGDFAQESLLTPETPYQTPRRLAPGSRVVIPSTPRGVRFLSAFEGGAVRVRVDKSAATLRVLNRAFIEIFTITRREGGPVKRTLGIRQGQDEVRTNNNGSYSIVFGERLREDLDFGELGRRAGWKPKIYISPLGMFLAGRTKWSCKRVGDLITVESHFAYAMDGNDFSVLQPATDEYVNETDHIIIRLSFGSEVVAQIAIHKRVFVSRIVDYTSPEFTVNFNGIPVRNDTAINLEVKVKLHKIRGNDTDVMVRIIAVVITVPEGFEEGLVPIPTPRRGALFNERIEFRAAPVIGMVCARKGCGKIASKRCIGCEVAIYCGLDCYRADWPVHKITCISKKQLSGEGNENIASVEVIM